MRFVCVCEFMCVCVWNLKFVCMWEMVRWIASSFLRSLRLRLDGKNCKIWEYWNGTKRQSDSHSQKENYTKTILTPRDATLCNIENRICNIFFPPPCKNSAALASSYGFRIFTVDSSPSPFFLRILNPSSIWTSSSCFLIPIQNVLISILVFKNISIHFHTFCFVSSF